MDMTIHGARACVCVELANECVARANSVRTLPLEQPDVQSTDRSPIECKASTVPARVRKYSWCTQYVHILYPYTYVRSYIYVRGKNRRYATVVKRMKR